MIKFHLKFTFKNVLMNRNIFKSFLKKVDQNPSFKFIKTKENNKWKWHTREDIIFNVNGCIKILNDYNIRNGDRIVYKGKNSVEWLSWNLATYSVGAIWIPMYEQQELEHCNHIVRDSGSKLLITDQDIKLDYINIISNKLDPIKNDFCFKSADHNNISNLIYTSGTTGKPKGVKLSHENILSNIDTIHKRFNDIPTNITSLNILPWAHIYGLSCELYYNLLNENSVALCTDKLKFIEECKEVNPEVLYVVPKVLETVKNKVKILDKPIIKLVIPHILKKLFGGNLQTIFSGGAKLDRLTRDFFEINNIPICEGYGCSELSPMVSVNHLHNPREINSIGKILDNIDVKIFNGEICVSGPNVMEGYWNDEEKTNEVLFTKENKVWYATGDSGYIENDFLYYSGRISENYKMSNGKFVNVNEVESKLKEFIKCNFIIYGENMDNNVLVVDGDFEDLNIINNSIESYLSIKKVIILNENEMANFLTPKMSIKRKALINYIKEKGYI